MSVNIDQRRSKGDLGLRPRRAGAIGADAGYRWAVASRVVAAVAGGYAVAALGTVFLGRWLPLATAQAVLVATLLSFLLYTAAVLWVFAAATAARAWLGLGLCAALFATALLF